MDKYKAVIPLKRMCCDFLEDISLKESTYRGGGQAKKEVCSVFINTTQGKRQCFGALNVRLDFALKVVSRHFTPKQNF
jgi:hypothetical protein